MDEKLDTTVCEKLDTTVCIVGGGPAGIVAGLILARAGVDVVVLEKHAAVVPVGVGGDCSFGNSGKWSSGGC